MKTFSLLFTLLLGGLFFGCSSFRITKENRTDKDEFELYILMGQSNMAGRGVITDSMKSIHNNKVWMLTKDNKWVVAHHPVHFDKPGVAGVGPGLSFGIAMAEARPGRKIGLIPCAIGGTSIDKWQPGAFDSATSTHPYDDAVLRITEAMKQGKIKGMLWLQGESDTNEDKVAQYPGKFKQLVDRIRKLTGDKNLPVVVGELGRYKSVYQLFNRGLQKLPALIPNTAVVTSEGLIDKGDLTHFDTKSASIYGVRFATGMQKMEQ